MRNILIVFVIKEKGMFSDGVTEKSIESVQIRVKDYQDIASHAAINLRLVVQKHNCQYSDVRIIYHIIWDDGMISPIQGKKLTEIETQFRKILIYEKKQIYNNN